MVFPLWKNLESGDGILGPVSWMDFSTEPKRDIIVGGLHLTTINNLFTKPVIDLMGIL